MSADARKVFAAQGFRAFAYGFGAVLLGTTLDARGLRRWEVGVVLGAVVAGTAVMSVTVARYGDRVGRRRFYAALYVLLAATGLVFALDEPIWLLVVVSLAGALSTDVIESGPFTSLEQAMLATALAGRAQRHGFGTYNAVAAAGGSLGALVAAVPQLVANRWSAAPSPSRWFLVFVPVAAAGALIARSLSDDVEFDHNPGTASRLERSRPIVVRLSSLFALDSFAGGFTVSAFVAYWLRSRFDASPATLGLVFFAVGLLQTMSFVAAPRVADRFGLLGTMVFTHLPSNLLLAAVAFAPNLVWAVGLLLARTVLSQMDVPTRQSYVMALVDPDERTPAAAYTNTARYVVRPFGPPLASVAQQIGLGAPFLVSGGLKAVYDVALWRWFRRVPLPDDPAKEPP